MRAQTDFNTRIKTINKSAQKNGVMRRTTKRRLGERLVTPLMLLCCLMGGLTAYWDYKDRPTETPFEMAGDIREIVMNYLNTI